jgi:MFS family permease
MTIEAAHTFPPRGQANYLLAILMVACFLSFTDRFVLVVLMPAIQVDLGLSDTQLSLLQGVAFSLFFSITAMPFGWLVDRTNRRNIAAFGIALWCLATTVSGLTHSFPLLLIARSLVGIGEATLMPAAFSMLSDSFPFERRGRALGLYTSAAAVGTGGALVVGGAVMGALKGVKEVHLGFLGAFAPWQMAFMVVGAPGLIVALLLLTVREPARRPRPAIVAKTASSLTRYAMDHRILFLCVLGAYSTYTAVSYSVVSWAPTLLVRKFHAPISMAGFLIGTCALTTGVIGTLAGGWLSDYWTRRKAIGGKFRLPLMWSIFILPVVLGYALTPWLSVTIACFAIFIAMQNAVYASGGAVMQDVVPPSLSGRATAIWYVTTGLVGQITGPTLVALLNDYLFKDRGALPFSIVLVAFPGALATLAFAWFGRKAVDRARSDLGEKPDNRTAR